MIGLRQGIHANANAVGRGARKTAGEEKATILNQWSAENMERNGLRI
jgi:hypothetical protein